MNSLPITALVSARREALRREAEAEHLARLARRVEPKPGLSAAGTFAFWMSRIQAGLLR